VFTKKQSKNKKRMFPRNVVEVIMLGVWGNRNNKLNCIDALCKVRLKGKNTETFWSNVAQPNIFADH
jgi:hypothetical protein